MVNIKSLVEQENQTQQTLSPIITKGVNIKDLVEAQGDTKIKQTIIKPKKKKKFNLVDAYKKALKFEFDIAKKQPGISGILKTGEAIYKDPNLSLNPLKAISNISILGKRTAKNVREFFELPGYAVAATAFGIYKSPQAIKWAAENPEKFNKKIKEVIDKTPEALSKALGVSKEIGKAILLDAKDYATDPYGYTLKDPFYGVLNASIVLGGAGQAVKGIGGIKKSIAIKDVLKKTGGKVTKSNAKEIRKILDKKVTPEKIDVPLVNLSGKKPIFTQATKEVSLSKNPVIVFMQERLLKGEGKTSQLYKVYRNATAKTDVANFLEKEQGEFIKIRNEIQETAKKEIKKLDKADQKLFSAYIEGKTALIKETSPELAKAINRYKAVNKKIEKKLIAEGMLTKDIADIRRYLPYAKSKGWVDKEGKFTKPFNKVVEAYKKEGKGLIDEPLYYPHEFPKTTKELLNPDVVKWTDELVKKGKITSTQTIRKHKPSFLKKAKGSEGYITDINEVLPAYYTKVEGLLKSKKMIERLDKNYSRPLTENKGLLPGYREWRPGDILTSFKKTFDFKKEVINKVEKMSDDELISRILENTIKLDDIEKTIYKKVKKPKKQIPVDVYNEMQKRVKPTPSWLRMYDKFITEPWRTAILPFRPAWIMFNMVGNETFMALKGVLPKERLQSVFNKSMRKLADRYVGGRNFTAEMSKDIHWGKYSDTWFAKLHEGFSKIYNFKYNPLKYIERFGWNVNKLIERYARHSIFISRSKEVLKEQMYSLGKKGKRAYEKMSDVAKLKAVEKNPKLIKEAIDTTNEFLNDYTKMYEWQRRIGRRFFPFISFTLHILRLSAKLPVKYPGRSQMIKTMSQILEEAGVDYNKDASLKQAIDEQLPPEWLREAGSFNVIEIPGKQIRFNPFYFNPFSMMVEFARSIEQGKLPLQALDTAGMGLPSHPLMSMSLEMILEMDMFTRRPFEKKGVSQGYTMDNTGKIIPFTGSKVPPDIILRKMIPQYNTIMKLLKKPLSTYSGESAYKFEYKGTTYNLVKLRKLEKEVEKLEKLVAASRYFGSGLYVYSPKEQEIRYKKAYASVMSNLKREKKISKKIKEDIKGGNKMDELGFNSGLTPEREKEIFDRFEMLKKITPTAEAEETKPLEKRKVDNFLYNWIIRALLKTIPAEFLTEEQKKILKSTPTP